MYKKLTCLVLALIIMCTSFIAFADTTEAMEAPASPYFSAYYPNLNAVGGGIIQVGPDVHGYETSAQLGISSYDIFEKKANESSFSLYASGVSGSIGYNTIYHGFTKHHSATVGAQYYVRYTFYCLKYDGSSGSVYMTSPTVKAY